METLTEEEALDQIEQELNTAQKSLLIEFPEIDNTAKPKQEPTITFNDVSNKPQTIENEFRQTISTKMSALSALNKKAAEVSHW